MAKIDTTRIEGYESMTAEQKVAALEAIEFADNTEELERYKKAASKANSEAADWKKKHNALLSDEERNKQQNAEEINTLRDRVAELEKEKLISTHKSRFLALGYDEQLAAETADAMANGDTDKVFEAQRKFLEHHDKSYKATLLGQTPTPPAGSSAGSGKTDYAKMIEDAQGRGDFAAVAYYTRLSEQENQNNK